MNRNSYITLKSIGNIKGSVKINFLRQGDKGTVEGIFFMSLKKTIYCDFCFIIHIINMYNVINRKRGILKIKSRFLGSE